MDVKRETNLYCFKPAWLLYLVVDDRLVLIDALISSSREDHILDEEKETHRSSYRTKPLVIWLYWHSRRFIQSDKITMDDC